MVGKRLGMIITRWKDNTTLQMVCTVMKRSIGKATRITGNSLIEVTCPNDVIVYQQNMDGVDRSARFANV